MWFSRSRSLPEGAERRKKRLYKSAAMPTSLKVKVRCRAILKGSLDGNERLADFAEAVRRFCYFGSWHDTASWPNVYSQRHENPLGSCCPYPQTRNFRFSVTISEASMKTWSF